MGSDNAGSILAIRDENFATDKPFIKVDQIGTTIDKDLYQSYVEPLRRDIAVAAYNLPLPLLDSASLSYSNASGEVIKELQKVYRNSLLKIRKRISRELFQLFDLEPSKTEIKDELSNSNPSGIL